MSSVITLKSFIAVSVDLSNSHQDIRVIFYLIWLNLCEQEDEPLRAEKNGKQFFFNFGKKKNNFNNKEE